MARTGVPIVEGVSFSIEAGRTLGLVGESGSGKSTVAVGLLGYARRGLEIAAGTVRIGDTDILALDPKGLRSARGRIVSYVPQDPAAGLNPAHRLGPQLREAITAHGDVPKGELDGRVNDLLESVNLPATKKILRSYPHQISGGQQQRIAIAIAFACRPRLIVLDEPTTGLDVTTQRHILATIDELASVHDAAAVYVSHDLAAVAEVATDTAVMYAGRIVERAPTARLFAAPRHPYTVGLIASAPSAEKAHRLLGIEGHPPRPGSWPDGCAYADRCPRALPDCRAGVPKLLEESPGQLVRCINPVPIDATTEIVLDVPTLPTSQEMALSVRGLVADYSGTPVLHDIQLDVPRGKVTAVVGESGSGKTTLARCLVGLHSSWQGEVLLGTDSTSLAPGASERSSDQLREMQYIFQNPFGSLNPTMTVVENVEEPLRHFERISRAERRARAIAALETVSLGAQFADTMPGRMSGGERQRAAVARGLVVEPSVLVCDEITSALDVSVQALLVEQLRDLQIERNLSMVFITHNLAVVRSIAQNMIVLQQGRIVEQGTVDAVLGNPQHPYTRQLLEDLPRLEARAGSSQAA
ncbi:MAG: peptide ABC transporter ATP-binding protein [Solirubrobacterales bacterium 70-9]|nr:MAG: peptide ABC transporter ATP-binding protein [Solirubrobacterales bacterium 70-9]